MIRTSSNAVKSSSSGATTLQTNVLSEVPTKIASPVPHKCAWLGFLAVEICNPDTGEKKSIYAFHDTGSQMTLLRKSTMEGNGLHRTPYVQSCRRTNIDAVLLMEDASLLVCRLTENEFHSLSQVRITYRVPSLEHSLLNMIEIEEHPNFYGIEYHTLNRSCYYLLIGADHFEWFLPQPGEEFRRVS